MGRAPPFPIEVFGRWREGGRYCSLVYPEPVSLSLVAGHSGFGCQFWDCCRFFVCCHLYTAFPQDVHPARERQPYASPQVERETRIVDTQSHAAILECSLKVRKLEK
jgi:hypothetical protein